MSHVIFNFGNISQATWIARKEIKCITVVSDEKATVSFKNGEAIEVTREEIKPVIENKRLESSKNLEVLTTGFNTYLVRNPNTNTEYIIEPRIDYLFCNCSDYKNQSYGFETSEVCCKHVFAVLGYLGFSKLSEYQDYVNERIIERLEAAKQTESEYLELENDRDFLK